MEIDVGGGGGGGGGELLRLAARMVGDVQSELSMQLNIQEGH